MSNRTSLRMRVLPRFPARISGTNGLTVVQDNLDLVVKPDFGSLVPVPSVQNPTKTFFLAWESDLDSYSSISFQNLVENIQDVIIGPTTAAMEATSPAADQFIYFTGTDVAATTGLTAAGRALLDDANAAAQRATLELGTAATQPSTAFATAAQGTKADSALQQADIGALTARGVAAKEADYARVYDKEIWLQNISNIDLSGGASSSTAFNALLDANRANGAHFRIPRGAKIKLDIVETVLTAGQKLSGGLNPNDAAAQSYDYTQLGYSIRLANGAQIRMDNASELDGVLIYRANTAFNVDQGDFSAWTGNGVVIAYGNDQKVTNCMILGFNYCLRTLNERGLAGAGRVILKRVYVDGKNGILMNGSYDNAFFDELRGFGFVTQGYVGFPVPGEGYDPRKDRRPGIGFRITDRADGTSLGRSQFIGYQTNYDINIGGFDATCLMSDYFTTPTYPAPAGTVGILLHRDVDETTEPDRNIDAFPALISIAHAWSSDIPIKIIGRAGRPVQIGIGTVINAGADGIQIDGGGLICQDMTIAAVTGAPVRFLSAPDTKTIIHGTAQNFGPARNSSGVPVVSLKTGAAVAITNANSNLIDVKLANDQATGSAYFDNHPIFPTVASADPLSLPAYAGGETESFTVTGTAAIAFMYGLRPGNVRLYFSAALSLFNGAGPGGLRLPGNVNTIDVAAGSCATCEYDRTSDRWTVMSISAAYVKFDTQGRAMLASSAVSVNYIGTDTPEAQLSKAGAARLGMGRWTNDAGGPQLQFVKSRNAAVGGHTIVAANDVLASIRAAASDGSTFLESASIVALAETVPSGGGAPGYLSFRTAKGTDNFASEKLRVDSFGNIIAYALRQFANDAAAAAATPPVPINGFYINSSTKALQARLA